MKYFVTLHGRTVEVEITADGILVDGEPVKAELTASAGTPVRHLLVGSRPYLLVARPGSRPGQWRIAMNGRNVEAYVLDERSLAIRELSGGVEAEVPKSVTAPMPGLVVRVNVEAGQAVVRGQGIVVVEAMKMENELRAPADGVVSRIEVAPGDAVEKGATLVVLE